ncbi:hypothetical protein E5F05_09700 [Deinococcus metallilatus]|uniref:Uncharacterized protein n=2 Tax=Deinococcus TaxID=1298 RepID=A0AAJ5F7Z6_9DEIO|nr:hypothetical protein [Deinococcus metallilatus]MBB5295987.1 hypothetical protein [Deinococcus metallilatus]QBY08191.1 hypothetical protein E5F05_09700 [Deinococcus metallilatus]RXJ12058.1 hypothetical protein ERJ73_08510 [Deinococcus metallilatus]TLK25932.1 hypothetical protein FCS05_12470 [Deinococcus metallilatus]
MLNTLALPLLFSMLAGTYAYLRFPDRRTRVLLTLILFQLVGAYGYRSQPEMALFSLLALHGLIVFALLLHSLQTPRPELAPERIRRK